MQRFLINAAAAMRGVGLAVGLASATRAEQNCGPTQTTASASPQVRSQSRVRGDKSNGSGYWGSCSDKAAAQSPARAQVAL
jgi:hypothetical protein